MTHFFENKIRRYTSKCGGLKIYPKIFKKVLDKLFVK